MAKLTIKAINNERMYGLILIVEMLYKLIWGWEEIFWNLNGKLPIYGFFKME